MTATLPPGAKRCIAPLSPSLSASSSSFTAIRSAWNVFVAGCVFRCLYQAGTERFTIAASSLVVSISFSDLVSTIDFAILRANRSSPYAKMMSAILSSSRLFIRSFAVSVSSSGIPYVIRSGSSVRNENPLPTVSWKPLHPRSNNACVICGISLLSR